MFTTDLRIRTVFDLGKALRNGDPALWFPGFAELNAWNTIDKHVGRTNGERLSETMLRRLEIRVADHSGLEMYILERKSLSEFADLCDGALGHKGAGTKEPRRKRGRPRKSDPEHNAKLTNAWRACGSPKYKDGVRILEQRFPGLTDEQLRRAVDLHRKNVPKWAAE